ncbi:RNA-guided endonuclease InsQ/TnpB family protein [Ferroplasma acidiphilum]|uniref:IS200/IS605 family element transposase accessory protein TnpB n=1 Tax=Ferroplasma acidiphilum TaxID=74969 RepID=A0A7K4FP68_9ARCH|nr:RNA-guided endonuclease TnpB family protein [Ferroplasma acidiphilum]NOL60814.1 IS200/IS605 family element transposase accessory protein TnpB [Ferroplasma acidiphilum]
MILTYKIKHGRNFSEELNKARLIAEFAIKTKSIISRDVKQFGLKSAISNQILRKYSRNSKAKDVHKIKLTVPHQGIKCSHEDRTITITPLKLTLNYYFRNDFDKINQIELDNKFAYVSINIPDNDLIEPNGYLGVDRNTTGHIAVAGNPETGKIIKLGKEAGHVHKKYSKMRKNLQKKGKYRKAKRIKNRESRIVKDINHKVARKIVQEAKDNGMGIKLEYLNGIRNAKSGRSFRYSLNSWSFYELKTMIEYRARLPGIPVAYVDPYNTSKECSRCEQVGNRSGKSFKCTNCGHVDHADANASFNIALRPVFEEGIDQLYVDRDAYKGNTGIPKEATLGTVATLEPHML